MLSCLGFKMADFNEWVDETVRYFCSLTRLNRNIFMETLFKVSTASEQIQYIEIFQESIEYRDFFSILPVEVSAEIVKYLEFVTMKNCCFVSRRWRTVVHHHVKWHNYIRSFCSEEVIKSISDIRTTDLVTYSNFNKLAPPPLAVQVYKSFKRFSSKSTTTYSYLTDDTVLAMASHGAQIILGENYI